MHDTFLSAVSTALQKSDIPQRGGQNSQDLIFEYQRGVYDELCETLADFQTPGWTTYSVRPRWHRLIIGPTGTGKSHIAESVARNAGWPVLHLSVTDWVLLGCSERAATSTWQTICIFLANNEHGVIILDEIDKIDSPHAWQRMAKVEIYDALDGRLPAGLRYDNVEVEGETLSVSIASALLEKRLRSSFWFLGAGAFQQIWNAKRDEIGFRATADDTTPDLTRLLDAELVNRFGGILTLSSPLKPEYRRMLQSAGMTLPLATRATFWKLGEQMISEAVAARKGARFIEEVVAKTIRAIRLQKGDPAVPHSPEQNPVPLKPADTPKPVEIG